MIYFPLICGHHSKKILTTHKLVVKPVQQAPDLSEDVGQIVELPTPIEELNLKMIIWLNWSFCWKEHGLSTRD